jgi:hypothetical protein
VPTVKLDELSPLAKGYGFSGVKPGMQAFRPAQSLSSQSANESHLHQHHLNN